MTFTKSCHSMKSKYLLDTNICIELLHGRYPVSDKIKEVGIASCKLSEITIAELYYGAYNSKQQKHLKEIKILTDLFEVIPISDVLSLFGKNKTILRQQGLMIDNFDLLIGSTAVAHDCILVTDNIKHLDRIPKVKTENWISR